MRYNGTQFTVFNHANPGTIDLQRFSSLYEDREGSLWIKSEDKSLVRYRNGQFKTYTTEQGLPERRIVQFGRTADGELLVRTPKGLACFRNERFELVAPDPLGFESTVGHRGSSCSTDRVWYRQKTELRRVSDGSLTVFQMPDGESDWLYEDRLGRMWIGTEDPAGVAMLKGNTLRLYTVKDGLPPKPVISFCEDRTGTLWFGTNGGGLVRFKNDMFATFTTGNGLASNYIHTMLEDREGIIWLGTTDNGLMRMTLKNNWVFADFPNYALAEG